MRLLDLFCGAGGAAMGYHRAGFDEIVGVDNVHQPRYPFEFVQADALEYVAEHGREFDVIHASPPCQLYSVTEPMKRSVRRCEPVDLVGLTRKAIRYIGLPYIIENVEGAPLENALRLRGSMFGLKVKRSRLFETRPVIWWPPADGQQEGRTAPRGEYDRGQRGLITVAGNNFDGKVASAAMGIDWMTRDELAQAIPPAYTEWLGRRLLEVIGDGAT